MNKLVNTSKGLAPSNLEEAMKFAELLSQSTFVPKDFQGKSGNVLVALQWGYELGLAPLQAMQNIAVINGRPSIWGDAMLALVRASGLLESIKEYEENNTAYCLIKRKGEEAYQVSFSLEDAKRAGLLNKSGPWTQYPKRMLKLRARAFALRDVFADVLKGLHIAEEARDMPNEKDMGKVQEVNHEPTPNSRKARVLQALGDNQTPQLPTPEDSMLKATLDTIDGAVTIEELKQVAELAQQLPTEEEKEQARAMYLKRKDEINRAIQAAATEDAQEQSY